MITFVCRGPPDHNCGSPCYFRFPSFYNKKNLHVNCPIPLSPMKGASVAEVLKEVPDVPNDDGAFGVYTIAVAVRDAVVSCPNCQLLFKSEKAIEELAQHCHDGSCHGGQKE